MPELAARIRDRGLVPAWIACLGIWRALQGDHSEAMWMSREGRAVLDGTPLVHPDQWGWAPQPWDFIPTSPGWELVSAAFWKLGGVTAFAALSFLVTASALWVLALIARELGATPTATVLALTLTGTLASGVLTSRAGVPAFTLLLVQLLVFWRLRTRLLLRNSWRGTLLAAVLGFGFAYAGIWLHGSWTLFAVVAAGGMGIVALGSGIGTRPRQLGTALVAGAAALLATVCGPLGISAWSNTLRVAEVCKGLVKEWTSPWQLGTIWPGIWSLMLLLLAHGLFRTWRSVALRSMHPLAVVMAPLAVGGVLAGASAVRFLLLGTLAATPLLAWWWSAPPKWLERGNLRQVLGERAHEPYWRTITAALVAMALPYMVLSCIGYSPQANEVVRALPSGCRLFSSDYDAKFVEFWRPDVRVWVDGRQDYWGRPRLIATQDLLRSKRSGQLVPPAATCVLLEKHRFTKLEHRLDANSAWTRIAEGQTLLAWRRNSQ